MKTNFTLAIILLSLPALFFISCSKEEKNADAYGNFEATEILISAKSNGTLMELLVEKGEHLLAGTKVGQIDTTHLDLQRAQLISKKESLAAKVDEVDAQLEILKVKKKYALINLDRTQKLIKEDAATRQQLDNLNAEAEIIEKQIRQTQVSRNSIFNEVAVLEKQLEMMEQQLADCRIINPIDGVVLEKFLETSELAMTGRPIYSIAKLDEMELKAFISARQLSQIKTGDQVSVAIDGAEELITYPGTISWIASKAEFTPKIIQTAEDRVNLVYAIKIRVKNDGKIKIAMPAEVFFQTESSITE
jgi:HlyD family secretion protein